MTTPQPSAPSPAGHKPAPRGRAAQRLETRERVFAASLEAFKQDGAAGSDIRDIVKQAGVALGTFYFHFPTKHHVVLEIEKREDARLSAELTRYLDKPHDLRGALAEVIRLILGMERRLGSRLFREVCGYHFSPERPDVDDPRNYATIVVLIEEIVRSREAGEIDAEADAAHSAAFFLLGVYGTIAAHPGPKAARDREIRKVADSVLRGLAPR